MSDNTSSLSSTMKIGAFGAIMAMMPLPFIFFLFTLTKTEVSEDIAVVLIIIQLIGCLIWAISLLGASSSAKKIGISSDGLTICAIGIFIGALFQVLFAFVDGFQELFFKFTYKPEKGLAVMTLLTLLANIPLAIGTFKLGNHLRGMRMATIWYTILGLYPLIFFFLAKIMLKSSGWGPSRSSLEFFAILISLILFVAALCCVIGWCKAAGSVSNLDEVEGYYSNDPVYVEQQTQVFTTQPASTTTQSRPTTPPALASAITDDQKNLLMGMSDQELTTVINNPMLYANPAFVEEARTMLVKRQAWEMIKDYSDAQLLDIVHNNTQGFAYEVLDATSMELLARENAEFVNEVASLPIDQLQGIISNKANYFDGYVRLAERILAERLNADSQPQQ